MACASAGGATALAHKLEDVTVDVAIRDEALA
jgi:hypothetical protein